MCGYCFWWFPKTIIKVYWQQPRWNNCWCYWRNPTWTYPWISEQSKNRKQKKKERQLHASLGWTQWWSFVPVGTIQRLGQRSRKEKATDPIRNCRRRRCINNLRKLKKQSPIRTSSKWKQKRRQSKLRSWYIRT